MFGKIVLVCGGRDWTDREAIYRELSKLEKPIHIIHGAAKGADSLAASVAYDLGFFITPISAKWAEYGRSAGMIRNRQMLHYGPELVLAFHTDIENSKGTKNMVEIARKAGVEVRVFSK